MTTPPIALHPAALARMLASLRAGRPAEAETQAAAILALNPGHAVARYLSGVAAFDRGRGDLAQHRTSHALALDPTYAPGHILRGRIWQARHDADAAIRSFGQAVALEPRAVDAWYRLAAALYNAGRPDAAEAWFLRLVERWPAHARSHYNLGRIARRAGRPVPAVQRFERARALDPRHGDSHYKLAMMRFAAGDTAAAIGALRATVALDAGYAHAHLNLGLTLRTLGRHAEAADALEIACRQDPALFESHHALGYSRLRQGDPDAAGRALSRAVALRPGDALAMRQRGAAFSRQKRLADAAATLSLAIALDPYAARTLTLLGLTSIDLGRLVHARDCFMRALVLRPDIDEIHFNLAMLCDRMGETSIAIDGLRRTLALSPDFPEAAWELLLAMTADAATSPETVLDLQCRRAARLEVGLPTPTPHRKRGDAERALIIGYVGRSFLSIVNDLTTSALRARDPAFIEQVAFATAPADSGFDPASYGLLRVEETWRLNDDALAQRIRDAGVDILVDMDGARPGNRLAVFARRPAPVQVTWIEAFYTMGLNAIDYLLTDSIHAPEGEALPIVETPVRLPGCRFCYAPPRFAPEVAPPPCLTTGAITFGSFNALNKLTPEVIALWADILNAVPGSRLLLKRRNLVFPEIRAAYAARFAAAGIGIDRLDLRGHSAHEAMLGEYGDVDIALDPFPYNGGRSTCEALWMGVPLVALRGRRMIARQSASILTAAGRREWIATDPRAYRDIAVALARDPDGLASLRAGQRERIKQSPLTDARRFARNLEAAYRWMWRRWCDGARSTC